MAAVNALSRGLAALLAGGVFGVGLTLAQMTDPRKVQNFLDLGGAWDPSLLFVLGGAVLLATAAFHFILRRPAPLLDSRLHLPDTVAIDRRLLLGSALFGVGWGLAGYCPGPALASIGLGSSEAAWVVPSMLAGAALQRWRTARRS